MKIKKFLLIFLVFLFSKKETESASVKCIACKAAVETFKFAYERNATSAKILEFATYICKTFTHHEPLICQGITSQFRDQFLYVLEQLLLTPSQLCGAVMTDCGSPHNPFQSNWTIPLPPKPHWRQNPYFENKYSENLEYSGRETFRVLQLSDLHFDFNYKPGAEADCRDPVCCQADSLDGQRRIKRSAGYWGTLASCDVPYWTIENMLEHISKTEKLDYIILSGDYMSHKDWSYTKQDHLQVIANLTAMMNKYFPETPTFWGIGNHEGTPVNTFAPHFVPKKFRPQWLYRAVYNSGRKWLIPENQAEIIFRGSFALKLAPKLKLISVNTGYCEKTNFFLYLNQTDPDETLTWLVQELLLSEKRSESVHIVAHIPPSDGECLEGWARNYYRIVQRFSDTIRAQFFGHIHWDSFSMFYEDMNDPNSNPVGVLYAAPSVTTFENINPAYRIYTVEGDVPGSKHDILDFETYFLNLSKSSQEKPPNWELLYRAKKEYNLTDLSPKSWQTLNEKLRTNLDIFDVFVKNYARRDDFVCDLDCRQSLLCNIRAAHHNSSALCREVRISGDPLAPVIRKRASVSRQDFLDSVKSAIWGHVSSWISDSL